MWSSRFAAVLLVISTPACAAIHTGCPASIGSAGVVHRLADAQVFQGPPSDKVELAPVNGDWDLGEIAATGGGEPFNLVCHYEGTTSVSMVAVPREVKACDLIGQGGLTIVNCH